MITHWTDRYPQFRSKFDTYRSKGWCGRCGYGQVPAIIVIDLMLNETDKSGESPIGSDIDEAVDNTVRILRAANDVERRPPVIFTVHSYNPFLTDASPAQVRKTAFLKTPFVIEGSKWVQLDPRIEAERRPSDPVINKKKTSSFWATPLIDILVGNHIDTLIITGCTTDSCVRATAIDSMNFGFNTIVPFDAVGSRDHEAAGYALFDIDLKYGDVVNTQEVIDYLERLRNTNVHAHN